MKRREFVLGLPLVLAAPAAAGQAPKRIAVVQFPGGMMNRQMPGGKAFVDAMRELGYVEGRDYLFDERLWNKQEEIPALMRDLLAQRVDVIVAAAPPSIVGAKAATTRVPVVMMYSAEPVAMGLVASLARPGGNITGLTWDHGFETSLKTLELLKEALPRLRRVGLIWDGTDSVHPIYARYFDKAAPQIGLALISVELRNVAGIEPGVARLRAEPAEAVVILPSGQITIPNMKSILALAMQARVPALVNIVAREYEDALMYYGPNLRNMPRRAAAYVDRILRGGKPAEIPIEQPDKYDLVVDLRAARKLGIAVPNAVRVRADRVIE
jgi:putative ABC transport system substrate-binding protein